MDIQFILDPYACATYIVSYISKGQRGMSNLLNKACEEARREDSDIRQQVRHIGNQFLSHVEIGAQEAAYLVLQMPFRRTSRSFVFINTSPPDERVIMLKPKHVLEDMKEDSTDIESSNIVKLYQQRPKSIEKLCLADFVSKFSVRYKKRESNPNLISTDDLPETEYIEDTSDDVEDDSVDFELQKSYMFRNGTEIVQRKKQCILRWVHFDVETEPEKFYRELLMLFTHWRNEVKDLKGNCLSFETMYLNKKDEIDSKRGEYEPSRVVVNTIEEAILMGSSLENECLDFVAPENEHNELIDRDNGDRLCQKYGCFNPDQNMPNYDIGIDLGIARKQLENEQITQWGEINDDDYRQLLRNLNKQQKEFLYHILHWVKTKPDPLYVFLTGGAGVGKSVVTRALYQCLLKYFSHQLQNSPDNLHVLLCAPTGKAAHNINGATIHSSFCLPVGQGFKYKPLDMQQLNILRSKYMHLKVIFIDEISMVGHGMFNFINLRLQEIKGCKKLFGGVSIIAVGDLFQLKPVMDGWIFSQPCQNYGPLATNLWRDNFQMFELTEIMRQKDDKEFAEILNRLREGKHTTDDLAKLKGALTTNDSKLSNIPHLFATRKEVFGFNEKIFSQSSSEMKVVIKAIDWVIGCPNEALHPRILCKVPDDNSKTMGLVSDLQLVIDVPAEITNNVNVQDGVTNGSPCIVKKFDYLVQDSERVSIVWVDFLEESTGQKIRTEHFRLYHNGIERSWTPILEITRIFKIQINGVYQVKRRQFPLQLAAAKTIHKSQGSTMQNAVIHFGNRKIDHIHYVGLSRVTHIRNLHILSLNESKIKVSTLVLEEMDRLRSKSQISLSLESFDVLPLSVTKVVFYNVRSLHRHMVDLKKDFTLLSADILAVSETRLGEADEIDMYSLTGFTTYRFDYPGTAHRPAYGLAIFVKQSILVRNVFRNLIHNIQVLSLEVACAHNWLSIKFLYVPPKTSISHLKELLRSIISNEHFSQPILIAGDFNFDSHVSKALECFMLETFNLRYLETGITTDYNSVLDQAFTNVGNAALHSWGTLESYYSDHKPIFICFN